MIVVSRLKHLTKYVMAAATSLAIGLIISFSAYAQTMGGENTSQTPSLQQIICGEELCTIGDPGNGGRRRVCWEIDKGEGKCDYACQGAKEDKPKACKKSGVLCRSVIESRAGCITVNNGNPISDDIQERDEYYKDYKEADYTHDEFMNIPRCPHKDSVTGECRCDDRGSFRRAFSAIDHARGNDQICQRDQVCITRGNGLTRVYQCVDKDSKEAQGINDGFWQDGEIQQLTSECPTYAQYVEKYGSGCWSCLVLEKLTSSFLSAASAGLKICQEAGIILLILGFAIWLAFWALKNVSSFTEIKGSNILNDLLKMGAKIVIAYCCINAGPTAIREFVITPIIGIGATIAQNFWYTPDDAKASGVDSKYLQGIETEDFEWITEEDQANMQEFIEREENVGMTPVPQDSDLTQEEQEDNEAIAAENNAVFAKTAIPNLLIPGVRGGCVTSGAGCRPASAGGSLCHQGVDVGCVGNAKNNCVPYIAAGPGRVYYSDIGGYGHMAKVEHGTVGKYDWKTTYNHMNGALTNGIKSKYNLYNGKEVKQGEPIGCVGSSGTKDGKIVDNAYAQHIHFEVYASSKPVDPLALPAGQIVFINDICGPFLSGNARPRKTKNCDGSNRITSSATESFLGCKSRVESWSCTKTIPVGGWPAAGEAVVALNIGDLSSVESYGSMRVEIPDVKYTGPTDIMPKSVMNSILGATKAITFNVAQYQILGEMVMCYSQVRGGGAHNISIKIGRVKTLDFYWTNFGMWIAGAILWFLGFMLTCVISFYLVDMSFKIGFAVMALPIVMGLWPFKATQGKLAEVVAIIAKASCDFAFLALTTYFGLNLVAAVYGTGIEDLFNDYDKIIQQTAGSDKDAIVNRLNDTFYLFSSTFLLLLFAIIYAYKLVSQTSKDLVEKFFPDGAFGNVSPMHKALTGAASIVNRLNKKYGMGLAGDIAATQLGKGVKKLGGKATGAVAAAPKAALNLARRGINKLKGGGKK